jgi:hypothetical protein
VLQNSCDTELTISHVTVTQVARGTIPGDYKTDMVQRKVVQYIKFSDGYDSWQGHGTHTSGSVAGSVYTGYTAATCPAGTVKSCWGECMTDIMCKNHEVNLIGKLL